MGTSGYSQSRKFLEFNFHFFEDGEENLSGFIDASSQKIVKPWEKKMSYFFLLFYLFPEEMQWHALELISHRLQVDEKIILF